MAGTATAVGAPLARIEGRDKVTGAAKYAAEYEAEDVAYGWIVQSTVARGTIRAIHPSKAVARRGVLAVITHDNAPPLQPVDDSELAVMQSPQIAYRGQIVGLIVADSLENARE